MRINKLSNEVGILLKIVKRITKRVVKQKPLTTKTTACEDNGYSVYLLNSFKCVGGADGTRTRDPRRDRPGY
jgi:hypothetical protein